MNEKILNIFPAIPGTTVTSYNCCLDQTTCEQVVFWALVVDEEAEEKYPFMRPMVMSSICGYPMPLYLPDDVTNGYESMVLGYNIPGHGEFNFLKPEGLWVKKGYVPPL